jgi:hypothetical protein
MITHSVHPRLGTNKVEKREREREREITLQLEGMRLLKLGIFHCQKLLRPSHFILEFEGLRVQGGLNA